VKTWRTPASASTSTIDGSFFQPWITQVGGDGLGGELANAVQIGAALGSQRFDHAESAGLRYGGGKFCPCDIGHWGLNDRIRNAEQRLDAIGHDSFSADAFERVSVGS